MNQQGLQKVRETLAAIPDERWITGLTQHGDRRCAYGHLYFAAVGWAFAFGAESHRAAVEAFYGMPAVEIEALGLVGPNDDDQALNFPGSTPKERVLNFIDHQLMEPV